MKKVFRSILGFGSGLLACAFLATPALSAGGTGSGSPVGSPSTNANSGGDDVETVPIVMGESGDGFVLEGSWNDVARVLSEASGPAAPRIFRAKDGATVQVIYQGRFELRLAKETLDRGAVKVMPFGRRISIHRRNGDWIVRG
jgi:hypothetical protein